MDQFKEVAEVPRQFMKEGTMFIRRCTKPDKKGGYNEGVPFGGRRDVD